MVLQFNFYPGPDGARIPASSRLQSILPLLAQNHGLIIDGMAQGNWCLAKMSVFRPFLAISVMVGILRCFGQAAGSLDLNCNVRLESVGQISQILEDPNGMFVITGGFEMVNGVRCSGIARITATGSLDPGFLVPVDIDGIVRTAAVQADGKILIGGGFSTVRGQGRRRIARLNPDGSLDEGFNPGGGFTGSTVPVVSIGAVVAAIAVQPDGNILVGGDFTAFDGMARTNLVRLNSTGGLDTTFSAVVRRGFFDNSSDSYSVQTILVQPSGQILVGGNLSGVNDIAAGSLVRLNADGGVDTQFFFASVVVSSSGVVEIRTMAGGDYLIGGNFTVSGVAPSIRYLAKVNSNGSANAGFNTLLAGTASVPIQPHAFELQVDGKILTSTIEPLPNGTTTLGVRRLNPNLTVDAGFAPGSHEGNITAFKLSATGAIVVGGEFLSISGLSRPGLARLSISGAVDPGFYSEVKYSGSVAGISQFPDGALLAFGSFSSASGSPRSRIVRVDPSGRFTVGFNFAALSEAGAQVTTSLALRNGKSLVAISSRITVGGSTNQIVRFNSDGSIDPDFNLSNGPSRPCLTMAEQPDGRVVLGGDFLAIGGSNLVRLARLEATGAIDPTFDPGSGPDDSVVKVILQGDGRIVVFGRFVSVNGLAKNQLARLFPGGAVDAEFNPAAQISTASILDLAIQSDDRLIAVGTAALGVGGVRRLNMDGTLDLGFQTDGDVSAYFNCIAINRDDSILIGGSFASSDGVSRNNLARLHPDGSVDSRFIAGRSFSSHQNQFAAIAFAPNGDVWVSGSLMNFNGTERSGLARLIGVERPRLSVLSSGPPVQIRMAGEIGRVYGIEVSTNLVTWSLVTNVLNEAGEILVADPDSANNGGRFYRALAH